MEKDVWTPALNKLTSDHIGRLFTIRKGKTVYWWRGSIFGFSTQPVIILSQRLCLTRHYKKRFYVRVSVQYNNGETILDRKHLVTATALINFMRES